MQMEERHLDNLIAILQSGMREKALADMYGSFMKKLITKKVHFRLLIVFVKLLLHSYSQNLSCQR